MQNMTKIKHFHRCSRKITVIYFSYILCRASRFSRKRGTFLRRFLYTVYGTNDSYPTLRFCVNFKGFRLKFQIEFLSNNTPTGRLSLVEKFMQIRTRM